MIDTERSLADWEALKQFDKPFLTVFGQFALWGLSQLLLAFLYLGVLWRWRTLLPLMYLLVVVEYAGRFAIGVTNPVVTVETPPGAIANFVFVGLGLVMLLLSLRSRGT